MTELEYRNRSISQLVSELQSLGEAKVVLQPVRLLAVHEFDMERVKRFKNSHGQQFFTVKGNDKKYLYSQIVQKVTAGQLQLLQDVFERGFNASLMFAPPREQNKINQVLGEVAKWMGEAAYSVLQFTDQHVWDLISDTRVPEKDLERQLKFYSVKAENSLVLLDRLLRSPSHEGVTVTRIRKLTEHGWSRNEVTLIVLPTSFFTEDKPSAYLSVLKAQLTQIFNYIKLNPAKKYQHFSKLLTKRLLITNLIASLVLEQSLCMIVNWINEGSQLSERLAFYERIRGISAFLKIEEKPEPTIEELPSNLQPNAGSRKELQKSISRLKQAKTDRTPIAHLLPSENELEYCRSFERKTHKYSLGQDNEPQELFSRKQHYQDSSEFNITSNNPSPVTHHRSERIKDVHPFDATLPKQSSDNLKECEEMAVLKANHAIEISQYHQTIQQLNKKVLALSQEHQLQELYTIHQRELMLLELKIKELREDIAKLCSGPDDKTYKSMVRKLNQEIKRLESKNSEQKVSNTKILLLDKQLAEMRKKYEQSESSRKKLAHELEYLTKHLKICDAEIEHLQSNGSHLTRLVPLEGSAPVSTPKLSLNDAESLREVQVLVQSVREGSEQSVRFLTRKVTNILEDLAGCRHLILDCNDFLMQLEEHLEERLGTREPQIVLDCNKFIRNFLMDNLNIF